MKFPYTKAEIDAFVENNLLIVGQEASANDAAVRADFAETIARLPGCEQVFLIESQSTNITGDQKFVHELYGAPEPVNGFFQPGKARFATNFNTITGYDAAVWHADARGQNGAVTFRHEHGHRIDRYLASGTSLSVRYLSDQHQGWLDALEREKAKKKLQISDKAASNPLAWTQKYLFRFFRKATVKNGPLYNDYRELNDHLDLYKNASSHPHESFAEMSNHYASLYAEHGGDEQPIDQKLTEKYSDLWPEYRDKIRPLMETRADALLEARSTAIKTYVDGAERLDSLKGVRFDAFETTVTAGILAASGKLYLEQKTLEIEIGLYKYPVDNYLSAKHDLEELRWEAAKSYTEIRSNPFVFNEEKEKTIAEDMLSQHGVEHVITQYRALRSERRAFDRFVDFESNRSDLIAEESGIGAAHYNNSKLASDFDDLMKKGGIAAVQSDIQRRFVSKKDINTYLYTRDKYERTRLNQQDNKPTPDHIDKSMREDLYTTIEKGGADAVKAETLRYQMERINFEHFARTADSLETVISEALGMKPVYQTHEVSLVQFDDLMKKGGLGAVATDIEARLIDTKDVYNYLGSRDEYERDRRNQHDAKPTPDHINKAMREDLYALLKQGGADAVKAETSRYKIERTNLAHFISTADDLETTISRAQGIEPAYQTHEASLAQFDELMKKGGVEAVKADIQARHIDSKDVHGYLNVRDEYERARINQYDGKPSPDHISKAMREDLYALLKQGGAEAVQAETKRYKIERNKLALFTSKLENLETGISNALDSKPAYQTHETTLAQFDDLLKKGGVDMVDAAIENLRVPHKALNEYVAARQEHQGFRQELETSRPGHEIGYGRKGGVYRPMDIDNRMLPGDFDSVITKDIRNLIAQGGADALASENTRLRQETHALIDMACQAQKDADKAGVNVNHVDTVARFDTIMAKGGVKAAIEAGAHQWGDRTPMEILSSIGSSEGVAPIVGGTTAPSAPIASKPTSQTSSGTRTAGL